MGRKIFIIGVLIISLMNPLSVLAGNLNNNESAIVEIAKGKFVVDGVTYKVSEDYIDSLINYLNSDDVDITKEQKEEVIQTMNNNLLKGVKEGYLVPVKVEQSNTEHSSNENSNSSIDEEFIKDFIEVKEPIIVVDNDKGIVRVTDENQTEVLTVNTVIKNTGFNLYMTVMIAVGLSVIMLGCVIVTIKFRLFAWQDE